MEQQAFLGALTDICGSDAVSDAAALEASRLADWYDTVRGAARGAVFPRTVEQVAAVLALCNAQRIPVTVQGGNTGMSGGAVPSADGASLILALQRMDAIREVDETARTMTVEAGCILDAVRERAAAHNLFFPLALGARGSCQIGGNLATNAGGLNVLRYGNTRNLCLGVEAVFADGQIMHGLSALHKDNTGYDLRHLLIGSEGTLAVITAATLKLFPPQRVTMTAWAVVPTPAAAITLMNFIQRESGGALVAFEIMQGDIFSQIARLKPEMTLPHPGAPPPWTVLLETAGGDDEQMQEILMRAIEEELAEDIIPAANEGQRAAFWQVREETPLILGRHGKWQRNDIALPLSALPRFIDEVRAGLASVCDGVYLCYGHVGDGNLHISTRPLDQDPDENPALTEKVVAVIYDCVAKHGGSFSAEHGIGQFKTALMRQYKDPAALAAMRSIKQALDVNNILNPGKVFG